MTGRLGVHGESFAWGLLPLALVGLALSLLSACNVYNMYWVNVGDRDGGVDASEPLDTGVPDASDDIDAGGPCEPGSGRDCCEDDPDKLAPGVCGCGVADTDADADGTPDCDDDCPQDPAKITEGVCGCGRADNDTDGDGTLNCNDGCPSDAAKTVAGVCGCGVEDGSSDSDETPDCMDNCPDDPDKAAPGVCGCGVADVDDDADGSPNCQDACANDPAKLDSGVCGCGIADADSDSDGTPNCTDTCPNDGSKLTPGTCGCGLPDLDSDSDGTLDCTDGCPNDAAKLTPGGCGCGVSDANSDGDSALDCNDGCPNDPSKQNGGTCGCGVAETDSDSDGTPDCTDGCDSDPAKTQPGTCGCGFPDAASGCLGLRSALTRRFSFNGTGTTVTDSEGGASGTVRNTTLSGSGTLVLSGTNQYVDLPTDMFSGVTNATIEAWVTWDGSSVWQRVFDFGNSSGTSGQSYLFLTPNASGSGLRAAYSTNGSGNETTASSSSDLATGGVHHLAVVVNDSGNALALYRDGALVTSAAFSGTLGAITYSQCWLGRSHYSADDYFDGTFYEVRVYNAALTASQLDTSFRAGPDATFF